MREQSFWLRIQRQMLYPLFIRLPARRQLPGRAQFKNGARLLFMEQQWGLIAFKQIPQRPPLQWLIDDRRTAHLT